MSKELIKEMLGKKVWAVVGATPNKSKPANHILHMLIEYGYEAYAVNPNYDEIEPGIKCYKSIEELPTIPDVIDIVIPPTATLESLKSLDSSKFPYIWLQPGTYNNEIVSFASANGFKVVSDGSCVMVSLTLEC